MAFSEKVTFGIRLKSCRKGMGLTQMKFSQIVGISQPNLSAYESGRFMPSVDKLVRIADALGVSVDYLLGLSDEQ